MALKQNDVNWFRPLWRRVAVVAFLTIWLGWEIFFTGETLWMVLVGAALAYSLYNFFYAFPKEDIPDEQIPPTRAPDGDNRQDP